MLFTFTNKLKCCTYTPFNKFLLGLYHVSKECHRCGADKAVPRHPSHGPTLVCMECVKPRAFQVKNHKGDTLMENFVGEMTTDDNWKKTQAEERKSESLPGNHCPYCWQERIMEREASLGLAFFFRFLPFLRLFPIVYSRLGRWDLRRVDNPGWCHSWLRYTARHLKLQSGILRNTNLNHFGFKRKNYVHF